MNIHKETNKFKVLMMFCKYFLFEIFRRETFDRLPSWIKEIKENSHDGVLIVVIGNKRDNHST